MKNKTIIFISVILYAISFLFTLNNTKKLSLDIDVDYLSNIKVKCDEKIKCNYNVEEGTLHIDVKPVHFGKSTIYYEGIQNNEILKHKKNVFVHLTGIISSNTYFGAFENDYLFLFSTLIILLLIIISMIMKLYKNIKKNIYSYENSTLLGLTIFISFLFIFRLFILIYDYVKIGYYTSFMFFIESITSDFYLFVMFIIPIIFLLSIFVTISNFILIHKEGKSYKNMLGIIFGSFMLIFSLVVVISVIIYGRNIINSILVSFEALILIYLECIFIGSCILGIISAKHIPKFDKDAIIILGCQIKKDGSLTKLLQSRVDRAIEFSKMQKEKENKNIIFIPSGGKGNDEIISESLAMKNYLISKGIKKENILIENKSTNTFENIKFSYKLISKKIKKPKLAFSTTNYHTFRAGIIATKQNIDIEGIGSKTKSYFWINAFIREFVATLVSERKKHIKSIIIFLIISIILQIITFL